MTVTAPHERASPAGRAATADRLPRRFEAAGLLLLVAGALALWALGRTVPNYDTYYHLVWGRELLDGATPTFEAYAAPTQHPLWLGIAALAGALLGEDADRALVLLCLLCWAALVSGAYRLGAAALGRWTGALGAAFVAASASFLLYAVRGYVDMPFLALVAWAGALEAERPRRGALPLTLLALAGLLRPEAWVLAGLYFLWLAWPRLAARRARELLAFAALTAAPPLVWAAIDLAVTGDVLHSLNATSTLAEDLGRERGIGAVPGSFAEFVTATVRPPVAALALIGVPLSVLVLGWVKPRVPLAMVAAGVATFAGTGVAGLSILPRYLTVPAVALCLLGAFPLTGWLALAREHPLRTRWRNAAVAAAVLGAVAVAILAPAVDRVRTELAFLHDTHAELTALLRSPAVTRARRCGPITFPSYRLVPDARWILDAPRDTVGARSARRRSRGVAIFVLTRKGLQRFGFADGVRTDTNVPDPGFTPLARSGRFVAYASCARN